MTGDAALRDAAESEGIEVRGTLWLLDRMVKVDILTKQEAATGLRNMIKAGRRLPKREVDRRLKKWEGD